MDVPSLLKRNLQLLYWMGDNTEQAGDPYRISPPASGKSSWAFGRFQNDLQNPAPRNDIATGMRKDGSLGALSAAAQAFLADANRRPAGTGPLTSQDVAQINQFLASPQGREVVDNADLNQAVHLNNMITGDISKTRFGLPLLLDPTSFAILSKIYNATGDGRTLAHMLDGYTVSNDGGGSLPSPSYYTLPPEVLDGTRPPNAADLANYVRTFRYGDQITDPTHRGNNINIVYRDTIQRILNRVPDGAALDAATRDSVTPDLLDRAYGLTDPTGPLQQRAPTDIRYDPAGRSYAVVPGLPSLLGAIGTTVRAAGQASGNLAADPGTGRIGAAPLGLSSLDPRALGPLSAPAATGSPQPGGSRSQLWTAPDPSLLSLDPRALGPLSAPPAAGSPQPGGPRSQLWTAPDGSGLAQAPSPTATALGTISVASLPPGLVARTAPPPGTDRLAREMMVVQAYDQGPEQGQAAAARLGVDVPDPLKADPDLRMAVRLAYQGIGYRHPHQLGAATGLLLSGLSPDQVEQQVGPALPPPGAGPGPLDQVSVAALQGLASGAPA